ncbi:MAG: PEP-CTERM sorting domain-containing protein [Terriglobales bacterium]
MKRTSRQRHGRRWWVVAVALLAIIAAVAIFVPRRTVARVQAKVLPLPPAPRLDFRAAREVYPFSVVPGGVYNSAELAASVEHDPVVRAHYKGVNPEGLAPTRLEKPMLAYVSYRKGDTVSWTRKKVVIPKDELVLTDGRTFVRGRCGNQITELAPPASSVQHDEDPPVLVFDGPLPSIAELPPHLMPVLRVPSVFYGARRARLRQTMDPVPEPGTVALVVSGAAVLAAAAWRRRRLF